MGCRSGVVSFTCCVGNGSDIVGLPTMSLEWFVLCVGS